MSLSPPRGMRRVFEELPRIRAPVVLVKLLCVMVFILACSSSRTPQTQRRTNFVREDEDHVKHSMTVRLVVQLWSFEKAYTGDDSLDREAAQIRNVIISKLQNAGIWTTPEGSKGGVPTLTLSCHKQQTTKYIRGMRVPIGTALDCEISLRDTDGNPFYFFEASEGESFSLPTPHSEWGFWVPAEDLRRCGLVNAMEEELHFKHCGVFAEASLRGQGAKHILREVVLKDDSESVRIEALKLLGKRATLTSKASDNEKKSFTSYLETALRRDQDRRRNWWAIVRLGESIDQIMDDQGQEKLILLDALGAVIADRFGSAFSEVIELILWQKLSEAEKETVLIVGEASEASEREDAICVLAVIGQAHAATALVRVVKDENETSLICSSAMDALCSIGTESVDPLLECLTDPSPGIRAAAAQSLGRIAHRTEKRGSSVDSKDREGTGVFDNAVLPLVRVGLEDSDAQAREWAVLALGEIGDPCAVEALALALYDCNYLVRSAAARALTEILGSQLKTADDYDGFDVSDPKEWQAWLDERKGRLSLETYCPGGMIRTEAFEHACPDSDEGEAN